MNQIFSTLEDILGRLRGVEGQVEEMKVAPTFPLYNVTNAAPGVTDDLEAGYSIHSLWRDTAGGDTYICTDATIGAAVWVVMA